ncbi:acyl-CoA N-acyltransferase [Laetiporus sulphureus 93-53]|uniref:Acyl-CoA N-acyltransferase n=1 Tax=Laetiporus sulphureus 93-53 TaxID=1314785 RepID=A0A165I996_9APHY|nr:acyl-CoA N-acyltransferase [Laetiporus sulphureus 93-53]KZT12760.1 acyl-CoA N-acyltransferase [Laetiporus sulphureus 93-53]
MTDDASRKSTYIREVAASDSAALSRICLLTGDAGKSAEHLHDYDELPGLIYAEPYARLPAAFGFVMVDPAKSDEVVGYILGTHDTRAFEREAVESWFPKIRERYPYHETPAHPDDPTKPLSNDDARYVRLLHHPPHASSLYIQFSPAHLHIDILPEYQRQGWGRTLIARAVKHLEEKGLTRVWLGLDPRNTGAKRFYEKLGFRELEGAPDGTMGLEFEDLQA